MPFLGRGRWEKAMVKFGADIAKYYFFEQFLIHTVALAR